MHIIISIIIGGLCGWLASIIMGSKGSILYYILAGIVGGALGNWLFGFLLSGPLGQIICGVAGTCLLIFLCRLIFRK